MSKFTSLVKKLREYEIGITSVDEEKRIVSAPLFTIFVEDDGSLDISFHVLMPPDEAGIICLILIEVKTISSSNKVKVGENYLPEKNGTCSYGNEAYINLKKQMEKKIIYNYVIEQKQLEYLMNNSICFNA